MPSGARHYPGFDHISPYQLPTEEACCALRRKDGIFTVNKKDALIVFTLTVLFLFTAFLKQMMRMSGSFILQ